MEKFNEMGPTSDYQRVLPNKFILKRPLESYNKFRIKAFNKFGVAYSSFIEVYGIKG